MQNMKKTTIIGVLVLIAIVLLAVFFMRGSSEQQVSKLDATDTVVSFYDQWLVAAKQPDTEPNRSKLAKSPILGKTLKDRLVSELKKSDSNLDPVLCQSTVPESISTRTVFQETEKAQILVTSRDKNVTDQAVVSLTRLNDGWFISDIQCSGGEFAPEREFTFEGEGYLLKGSIPAPYDSKNWHLVFEEDGVPGHVVPLLFNSESQCTTLDGNKAVCKLDQLTEAMKVFVQGQMTEYGVSVKQQKVVEDK